MSYAGRYTAVSCFHRGSPRNGCRRCRVPAPHARSSLPCWSRSACRPSARGASSFDTDVLSLLPRDGRVIPAFRRSSRASAASTSCTSSSRPRQGHAIADYADDDRRVGRPAAPSAGDRAGRRRASPIGTRELRAGSPIASCCCSAARRSTPRSHRLQPDGARAAVASRASCWRCRRRRSPTWSGTIRLGLFETDPRRARGRHQAPGARTSASTSRRRIRQRGRPAAAW